MALLEGEAHDAWMKAEPELRQAIEHTANGQDLAALREGFRDLVGHDVVTGSCFWSASGIGGSVYQLFCPMAFENKGAAWLQSDDEVRNPYFGAEMMSLRGRGESGLAAPAAPMPLPATVVRDAPPVFRQGLEKLGKAYLRSSGGTLGR